MFAPTPTTHAFFQHLEPRRTITRSLGSTYLSFAIARSTPRPGRTAQIDNQPPEEARLTMNHSPRLDTIGLRFCLSGFVHVGRVKRT
jgi:hypothetical protein